MKKNKYLARKSILKHPNGTQIATPLLVPSFSSKGFYVDSESESELNKLYEVASEYITESMLISAFDISYKNIKDINYDIAEITFIDSGGYEVANSYDLSTVYMADTAKKEWSEIKLRNVYKDIPDNYTIVLVNYDHPDKRVILEKQIEDADIFFNDYPYHLHTLLIKPEDCDKSNINIESVLKSVHRLNQFDIIGVTEKELGNSIFERMLGVAKIRIALDNAGIFSPLHIYGSLDPMASILYFIAGAEIFDGLTWLRYGFLDGEAKYYSNYGAKTHGIDKDDERMKLLMLENNISYLTTMKQQMKIFLSEYDFGIFGKNNKLGKLIEDSYRLLKAEIGGQNGRV